MSDEKEIDLARIESRKASFNRSPVWFTIWDIMMKMFNGLLYGV